MSTQGEHAEWRVLEIDGFARSNSDSVKSAIRYQSELTKPNSTNEACGLGYDVSRESAFVFLHDYASVNLQERLREAGFATVVPNTQPDRWLLVPNASIGTVAQLARVLLRAAQERYYG